MSNDIKYFDIFVPGGYPAFTYNPRTTLALEEKVSSALNNLCKLVIVTGHTKSGKTVLVHKILPREKAIWVDGGGIKSEDDFWSLIINGLNLFQTTEIKQATNSSGEISGEILGEGNIFVAKGGGKIGGKIMGSEEKATTISRTVTSMVAALNGLREYHIPLVIDDFHYLPKEIQGSIVRALKPLIFEGVPIVIIAIPHRRYDAVKVEKEMTGRILPVNIPLWEESELSFIPEKGFSILGVILDKELITDLACQSIGSPHLIQEFCREICKINPDNLGLVSSNILQKVFATTAETIGRPIFEKLARGPRSHSDRIKRKLKTGQEVDIYGLVLHGLSNIKPGLVTLEYEDLRSAIKEICIPENVPNVQEVARVLKHMAQIAATDQSSTPVIDFDEQDKRLHITDPFFAFYLRWGNIDH